MQNAYTMEKDDDKYEKTDKNTSHVFTLNLYIRYFHDTKNVYLLLEYLSGGELFKKISKSGGFLDEDTCRRYVRDIAMGLSHLHERGVMHRDIKPENILIGEDGKLRLTDLGWAVTAPQTGSTTPGVRYTMCGTPEYLAPEMVAGTGHTLSVDLWAMGILLYEMLYGRYVRCRDLGPRCCDSVNDMEH